MKRPTLHLICNAHLDPVWQWRWEEGCAEALSTFATAVELLAEHPDLTFNHNEAVLYRWALEHDPALFRRIRRLVSAGRWCIAGGWYLQPDVNLPGTESLVRHILEGRAFFREHFGVEASVAYNLDSFGHSGGLPQILRLAGYRMYIHMRPQEADLELPSDLYRWRGVDGSEVIGLRLAVGLYHTERDNIERRLQEGTELALRLRRDVPVFWGIGDHGGGATREDLEKIDAFIGRERRVRVVHGTTERLYRALKSAARRAPVVDGDLQRVFTGCYTSLSRIKRRAVRSLGEVVQAESLAAAAWWARGARYPGQELAEAWRDHLFNDFHDILPGSCVEPAEEDALDHYGRASVSARRVRLRSIAAFNRGPPRRLHVPVTVANTLAALPGDADVPVLPVEVECMADLRPLWAGKWHLRAFRLDGLEVPFQEEAAEPLLPFNAWRRKVVFVDALPRFGIARYEIRLFEGERPEAERTPAPSALEHHVDRESGLVRSLRTAAGCECLAGSLLQPLVVEDGGDSWGAECWRYRSVIAEFAPVRGSFRVLESGPVRTVTESLLAFGRSTIRVHAISYSGLPALEFRLRVQWNEARKRLELRVPTAFRGSRLLCEIPGGAIERPADGDVHVHGRWLAMDGGKGAALGIVSAGCHGVDLLDGELRLSVLRGAAYCHERTFPIDDFPVRKFMDQGIHEVRLLVSVGEPSAIQRRMAALSEWVSSPPFALAHLPIPMGAAAGEELLRLEPAGVRLLACTCSDDGTALILRVAETTGVATQGRIALQEPQVRIRANLGPFQIRTYRIERSGRWYEADLRGERG